MHGRTSSFQKGSLQQLSDRLSWVVHPLLFFFFSVITYNWPFTNTSKNDKLETENRFYVPFITQGTLQEFFSHFSLSFFFLLQVFMSKESKRMAQSQQKKNVLKSLMPPVLWVKYCHDTAVLQRNVTDGWGGKGKGFSLLQPGPVLRHIRFAAWHLDWYRYSWRDETCQV